MEVCSFCRESSDSTSLMHLEGLELSDHHGLPTLVTEVVREVLPEVEDANEICGKCLQVICDFYQLKRELRQWIEDNKAKTTVTKTATAIHVVYKQKNKKDTEEIIYDLSSSSDLEVSSQPSVLPNKELQMLKEIAMSSDKSLQCLFCSKGQHSQTVLIRHLILQHSKNQTLFRAWIGFHCKQSLLTTVDKKHPKCCVCRKNSTSSSLRLHMISHVIAGDVPDADFFSMTTKIDAAGKLIDIPDEEKSKACNLSDQEKEFVKAQCAASKRGVKDYQCTICSVKKNSYGGMYFHVIYIHCGTMIDLWCQQKVDEAREAAKATNLWPCCICSKEFSHSNILRNHFRIHYRKGEIDFEAETPPENINKAERTEAQINFALLSEDDSKITENEKGSEESTELEHDERLLIQNDELMELEDGFSSSLSCELFSGSPNSTVLPSAELKHARKTAELQKARKLEKVEKLEDFAKKIKDEYGEFTFSSSFGLESYENHLEMLSTSSLPDSSEIEAKGVEIKEEFAESLENEDEDDLLIENEEMAGNIQFSTSSSDTAQKLVLPSTELMKFKKMWEKSKRDGYRCPLCSKLINEILPFFSHLITLHSSNVVLFRAWIAYHYRKTIALSGRVLPKCCVCRKYLKFTTLRRHILSHIVRGHVGDAEFFLMRTKVDSKGRLLEMSQEELAEDDEDEEISEFDEDVEPKLEKPKHLKEPKLEEAGSKTFNDSSSTSSTFKILPANILPKAELQLMRQMSEEVTDSEQPCPVCFKPQASKQCLARHLIFCHSENRALFSFWVLHHAKNKLKRCSVCSVTVESHAELSAHLVEHLVSGEVDANFPSLNKKQEVQSTSSCQKKNHLAAEPKKQKIETSTIKTPAAIQDRAYIRMQCRASKTEENAFRCLYCSGEYINYKSMYKHIEDSQRKKGKRGCSWIRRKRAQAEADASTKWPCLNCEEIFTYESTLRRHLQIHDSKKRQ